jgi:hypothetical protein
VEIKKVFLDQSFRNYLTDELLVSPEQADLDVCKALVTLSIEGKSRPVNTSFMISEPSDFRKNQLLVIKWYQSFDFGQVFRPQYSGDPYTGCSAV